MTLKDMLETNALICSLNIDVRTQRGLLLKSYEIGPRATEDRFADENHPPRWECMNKIINSRDNGKDYWNVLLNKIPKDLLKREVLDWDLEDYKWGNDIIRHKELNIHLIGEDDLIETTAKELDGQMSIEEWNYGQLGFRG